LINYVDGQEGAEEGDEEERRIEKGIKERITKTSLNLSNILYIFLLFCCKMILYSYLI
jgi:hypothetical protein